MTTAATPATSNILEQVIHALEQHDGMDAAERMRWQAALRAAGPAAVETLACHGAVSTEDRFYELTNRIADEGWSYEALCLQFEKLVERHVPASYRVDVSDAANAMEIARWQGAYALGVAVGILLAGGAK